MRFIYFMATLELIELAYGLFEQCNHVLNLKANEKIFINSPFYPNSYPLGSSCRYTVHAPTQEHRLSFKCRLHLNVPNDATRCQQEAFYFNPDGSELLTNSDYFCGSGEIERQSFLNSAVISYVSQLRTTTDTLNKLKANELPALKPGSQSNTTAMTTVTPSILPPLPTKAINLSSNESDALAYILTLLNQTLTGATKTLQLNLTNDVISSLMWRRGGHNLTAVQKEARIVSNEVIDGGFEDGGGSFSCLVEVITAEQCECGWSNAKLKIAGVSSEAAVNEFPPMAGIMTKRMGRIFCGGTIINQRYVLSAAHCFTTPSTNRAELLRIVAGEHDTSTALESYYTRYYEIETLIVHEDFRSTLMTLRNDVALLRTTQPIEWNRGVGPACLPWRWPTGSYSGQSAVRRRQKPPHSGERLVTAGWGTTTFGGPQATRLLKTSLDVIGSQRCKEQLHVLPPHVFCTYTPGSDTCQYDSGGGLYTKHESRLYAVGVVSYGYACASEKPSVNARVAAFLKWIKRNTPDTKYCKK